MTPSTAPSLTKVDWYFDFISAFAYLQRERMDLIPDGVEVVYRPVLFAGLLNHHGQLGPAEIPGKRRFTYRYWIWRAARLGIPFRMPPVHPFHPLAALRLAVALDGDAEAIAEIFRFIWRDGEDVQDPAALARLAARLGVADLAATVGDPAVKQRLRDNTEAAAARGVFGVPSFAAGEALFWGEDATDMLVDYLADPDAFEQGEMGRVGDVTIGALRR